MKVAGILILGALPGIAVAYAALTGYLLNRVRPAPITVIPAAGKTAATAPAEAVAA